MALYQIKVIRSLDGDIAELFYVQTDELIARGTPKEVEEVLARLPSTWVERRPFRKFLQIPELGTHIFGHDVAKHWNRIDDVVGSHRVLGEVFARRFRVGTDVINGLGPSLRETLGDVASLRGTEDFASCEPDTTAEWSGLPFIFNALKINSTLASSATRSILS